MTLTLYTVDIRVKFSPHKSPRQEEVGEVNIDNVHHEIQYFTHQKLKVGCQQMYNLLVRLPDRSIRYCGAKCC